MNNEEINLLEWIEQYDFDALTEGQKNTVRKELGEDEYKAMRKLHLLSSNQNLTRPETPVFEDRLDRIFATGTISKAKGPTLRNLFYYRVIWWQAAAIFVVIGFSFWWLNSKRSLPEKTVEIVKRDTVYVETKDTIYTMGKAIGQNGHNNVSQRTSYQHRAVLKREDIHASATASNAQWRGGGSAGGIYITTLEDYGKVAESHPKHSIAGDELVNKYDYERMR